MFEKTLTDVVKGIRSSKRDSTAFISACIKEIKAEIHSPDMFVKANALQKLTFLQMMGYSLSWVDFATIEVMSSPRFFHKRIGYLAASQGFTEDTEVILLTTNLLKKELRGAIGGGLNEIYDAGLAINCLSNIVTEDLAKDLLPELTNLTSHPNPYLRKKAILCLFKLFVKYPQGLRLTFPRLQQCLEDSSSCVVSCAVNVVTELSDKNPTNYLHLAPTFFELLNRSSNNWMLIKVVKLLGSLVAEEPRLARKLLDPLAGIVKSTQAKSLLYESVHTITLCLPYCRKSDGSMPANAPEIVDLCAGNLLSFVKQNDQNLKYLGLVGFGSLMQSHPKVLSDPKYRPLILTCLSDEDITIRKRALDLLIGMVSRKNLVELITQLLRHVDLASGTYKHDLVRQILMLCSMEKYSLLHDFCWYLDVIYRLGHTRGIEELGRRLGDQFIDVALRVLPARSYAIRLSIGILLEREVAKSDDPSGDNGRGKHVMPHILPAAAWIVGEYSAQIQEAASLKKGSTEIDLLRFDKNKKGIYHGIIQSLMHPDRLQKLDSSTQMEFLYSAFKVYAAALKDPLLDDSEKLACMETFAFFVPIFQQSIDCGVYESAALSTQLLNVLNLHPSSKNDFLNAETLKTSAVGSLIDIGGEPSTINTEPAVTTSVSSKKKELPNRVVLDTLSYLLNPSPMKPLGSKQQRKKHSSIRNEPLELEGLYMDLIKMEQASAGQSIESVSFLQQRPLAPSQKLVSTPEPSSRPVNPSLTNSSDAGASSYNRNVADNQSGEPARNDPFYLISNDPSAPSAVEPASRFTAIQLLDSDQEHEVNRAKKGKRKKEKKSKPDLMQGSTGFSQLPDAFSGVVYDSDDEDVGADNRASNRKKNLGKEFAGLARVDLTAEEPPQGTSSSVRHRKKTKAEKKKKDKSDNRPSDTVGDLLDLGGGGFTQPSTTPTQNIQSIGTVFDLLNDYGVTPTSGKSPPRQPQPFISGQACHLWLKSDSSLATVFPGTTFLYRMVSQGNDSVRFVLRISNESSIAIDGLSITMEGQAQFNFEPIHPTQSSFFECTFASKGARQISAIVKRGSQVVPVMFPIPGTTLFMPASSLSLDHIAKELSSSIWETCSVKINATSMITDPSSVKEDVRAFFNAAVVFGGDVSANSGTFAATSQTGSPIRIMVKVKKQKAVKVDIKFQELGISNDLASLVNALVLT